MRRTLTFATLLCLLVPVAFVTGCGGTSQAPSAHTADDGGKTRPRPGDAPAPSRKAPPKLDD